MPRTAEKCREQPSATTEIPRALDMPTLSIIHFALLTMIVSFTDGNKNEWTPIPIEEVYRRLRFNFQNPTNVYDSDTPWTSDIQLTTESVGVLKHDVIKLVEPQKVYSEFAVKRFGLGQIMKNIYDVKPQGDDKNMLSSCEIEEETDCTQKLAVRMSDNEKELEKAADKSYIEILSLVTSTEKNARRAKKINTDAFIEEYSDNFLNYKEKNVNEAKYTIKHSIPTVTESVKEVKSYEVTENSKTKDLFYPEPKEVLSSGYFYKPPVVKNTETNSNITKTFLDILNKYKISKDDNIQNYEKSRVLNVQKPVPPQFVYLPLPINVQNRYNSLNHLPVNPVLAVLLSNYGIYLPNSYGIHSNYRNLYGYLASNNIHNNQPFGPYKLFADTDSSHK